MVRINDDYVIDNDTMCYTAKLDKHKVDKKGNEVFENIGYYSKFDGALKAVVEHMNKRKLAEGVHTLEDALNIILENNKYFIELLQKVVDADG